MVPRAEPRSYYGRPVIKPPVWTPRGAVVLLHRRARRRRRRRSRWPREWRGNERLAWRARAGRDVRRRRRARVLLISDLGRPERFLNMLRVFKPTSPMSVGSWLLARRGGPATALAAAWKLLGLLERASRAARLAAGLTGPPMATYTAVLLANTAVPVWHEARRELPFVFAGSAAASAGAAVAALTPVADAGPARRLTRARRRGRGGRGGDDGAAPRAAGAALP